MYLLGVASFIMYRKSINEGTCFTLSNPPKKGHLYADQRTFFALFSLFAAKNIQNYRKLPKSPQLKGICVEFALFVTPSRIMSSIKSYEKVLATQARSQMITY